VDAGLTGLLLIAWLCRVTHFRIFWLIVTVGTGLSIPAILIVIGTMVAKVDPAEGERILQVVGEVLFTSVAQSMPYMCGFLAYMLRSRRFRVTFESKLRDDDRRLLAQANGPGFPPPPRGTSAFVQGPR
jgi:hypothetical protein